jgi:hypothetical protein
LIAGLETSMEMCPACTYFLNPTLLCFVFVPIKA